MTTVVLVHGTGVREESYQHSFANFRARLASRRPDVDVKPCFWGGKLGAALEAKGLSVPGERRWTAENRDWEKWQSWEVARWFLLEADPLYELRILSVEYEALGAKRKIVPGMEEPFDTVLESAVRAVTAPDPALEPFFSQGREVILADPATRRAMSGANRDLHAGELGGALARALLAQAMVLSAEDGEPLVFSEVRKLLLTETIEDALGLGQLGIRETVKKISSALALNLMTRATIAKRSWALEESHPLAADVLLYLSRGETIRDFIRRTVESTVGPLVVLAHSLGGIACLDLAIEQRLAGIAHLVTVGSQGPLLYELDALTSLRASQQPPDLPPWTNFYDLRDPLAFVGEALFPGQVRDVLVDNGRSFPRSHTDYFDNDQFYDLLVPLLS